MARVNLITENDDIAANHLPLAIGGNARGVVLPVAKTAEMTQAVGVDANGALFTKAGGGGTTTNALSFLAANGTALDSFNGSAAKSIKAGDNITMTTADGVTTIAASGGGGGGVPIVNIQITTVSATSTYNFTLTTDKGDVVSFDSYSLTINGRRIHFSKQMVDGNMYCYILAIQANTIRAIALERYNNEWPKYTFNGNDSSGATDITFTMEMDKINTLLYANLACLKDDTLISTITGSVELRNLRVGDRILSLDPDGNICEDTVTYCDSTEPAKYGDETDIWYFDDGTKLETIHPHEFFSADEQKFRYIADFRIGERIVKADGTKPTLVKHEVIVGKARHMTLFTEKYNTYFANGVLTGNRNSVKFTKEI